MNIIHTIWVDDEDLDLIAEAGAVIAHSPISSLRLCNGVMPSLDLDALAFTPLNDLRPV